MRFDPVRCGAETSPASEVLAAAIEVFRRRSGRDFPTWGEVLEVIRGLGYAVSAPREAPR
jgi:uncharacterized membrane protein